MSLFRRKDWLNYSQQPGKIQISVCLLMKIIQSDWPEDRKKVPTNLQLYFLFREELSILNSHSGDRKDKREYYACQRNQTKPTTSESSDTRHVTPYQRSISVITLEDFFFLRLDLMDYAGKGYPVTVDYSNFFEVDRLQDKAAEEVI